MIVVALRQETVQRCDRPQEHCPLVLVELTGQQVCMSNTWLRLQKLEEFEPSVEEKTEASGPFSHLNLCRRGYHRSQLQLRLVLEQLMTSRSSSFASNADHVRLSPNN